ncbi:MAG: 5-formyltetrahydrofolate cyclo-ligase [Prevotella sp.]
MEKHKLREKIRTMKRQFDRQELERLSLHAINRLMEHERFQAAHTVMLYHALPDEVSTSLIMETVTGKRLLLPRVTGEGTMELCEYNGPEDMKEGAFHIMEPCGKVFDNYRAIDLAVVPGVAFDRNGNRLGRGKGYYDRFLPLVPQAYKIGICFEFQLVDEVPTDGNDIRMDEVIS